MHDITKRLFIVYTLICILSTIITLAVYGDSGFGEVQALWLIYTLVVISYKVIRFIFTGKIK